jgi:hypothetical protein
LHHGGSVHFVIEQPDGTRSLLPAWMTEPWAAQLTMNEIPRLTLEALHALRSAIQWRPPILVVFEHDEGEVR